jgi:hypothetical protein
MNHDYISIDIIRGPHLVKLGLYTGTKKNSSDTKENGQLGERVCVHCNKVVVFFQYTKLQAQVQVITIFGLQMSKKRAKIHLKRSPNLTSFDVVSNRVRSHPEEMHACAVHERRIIMSNMSS